jgi:hypothetical protein
MSLTIGVDGINLGTRYQNRPLFGITAIQNGILNFNTSGGTVPFNITPTDYWNENISSYNNFKSGRPVRSFTYALGNSATPINYNYRQIYISHGASLYNSGTTAATSTFSIPIGYFYPGTEYPYVNGGGGGTLTTIYFTALGYYYNASGVQTSIMSTSGVVSFKTSAANVWSVQTILRYNSYNSDGTNFPVARVNFSIQNSLPTLVYTSRTSQPAGAYSQFYTTMNIHQSF